MNYNASVSDFFKSAKWTNNMLLGAVLMLIPIVGQMALSGWHITCFWARGHEDDPAKMPPFDFQFFGKYLERGLWPFVVNMVTSLIIFSIVGIMILVFFAMFGLFGGGNELLRGGGFTIMILGVFCFQILSFLIYNTLMTPLIISASITQDFKAAFDFRFIKKFISLVWKEMLVSMLFMLGLGICAAIVAIMTCSIGIYFVMPLIIYSWHHLQKQLYLQYLLRGGEALLLSPKLMDGPPAFLPKL
jgi:Protein of unknown function (DUF4013)